MRFEAQRISGTAFTRPDEAVAWLGAVQAQDYLGALWAIGLRLTRARERDIEEALAQGSIVRTWPMRGTLHFVAAADARWMVELNAPRVLARAAGRLRALEIDAATLARARRVVVDRLTGGGRLTRLAMYEALSRERVSVKGQRGIHMLWHLAHECLICFGPREGKRQTLVLFDEWVPAAKSMSRDESLAELARRYFGGHGPATVADFAWWSGLTVADARGAVALARDRLVEMTVGERTFWLSQRPVPSASPRSRAYLLPAFDELLVGYTDRSAAVESAHDNQVNAGGRILNPTIVVDGRVVGTWRRHLARGSVVFMPALFAPLGTTKAQAVAVALRRYGKFLGRTASWGRRG